MFSVVFIVKNEEQSLPDAIRSLGTVPEVVVCDTGSTDSTVAVAKALGARVVHFSWCDDFSAARAFAQAQASHDWVVRFDADERLEVEHADGPNDWLGQEIERAGRQGATMLCVLREHIPGHRHWFPRCYRRSCWEWRYPVHEILKSPNGERQKITSASGAVVTHRPDNRPRGYRRLLEQAASAAPDDPYLTYHLGRACWEDGLADESLHWLGCYLETVGGYRWHRSEAELLRGRILADQGRAELAFEAFKRAATVNGPRAEPLLDAARLGLRLGLWEEVARLVERGRVMPLPQEIQMFGAPGVPYLIDPAAYCEAAWKELGRGKDSFVNE